MRNIRALISSLELKTLAPKIYEAWVAVDLSLDELNKKIKDLIFPSILYGRYTSNVDTSGGGAIVLTAGVALPIPFNLTRFQNTNFHDNTNNNTKFYITKEGFYTFGASISVDGVGAANHYHYLSISLTRDTVENVIAKSTQTDPVGVGGAPTLEFTLATGYYLYPGDVIIVYAFSSVAGILYTALTYSPEFWIMNYSRNPLLDV